MAKPLVFVGIDVAQATLEVAVRPTGEARQVANDEIAFGDVHIDKCFGCEGIWLDKGELEIIQKKDAGFMDRLLTVFRRDPTT